MKELKKAITREDPNILKELKVKDKIKDFIKNLSVSFDKDSEGFNLHIKSNKKEE